MVVDTFSDRTVQSAGRDIRHILFLTILAAVFYGFFHFSDWVTPDEVRYAIGVQELLSHSGEPFNYGMSFGYYHTLKPLIANLSPERIPLFLNCLSSLSGTLLLIPLFFLIKGLSNSRIAALTGVFLIFSPPFWFLTRYGHPTPPALLFFFSAMAGLMEALESPTPKKKIWLGFSILSAVGALVLRADLLLSFLLPLGLYLLQKERNSRDGLFVLLTFYTLTLVGYLILRWLIIGYLIDFSEGTIAYHFRDRLPGLLFIFKSLLKNTTLFIVGFLPLFTVGLFGALIRLIRAKQYPLLRLIGLWILPTAIFLPFWGMDFSRLYVPIIPALLFVLLSWLDSFPLRRLKYAFFVAVLIAAHAAQMVTAPLLVRLYPFKTIYQNRPIAMVPIEPIFRDYFLRRDYLRKQQDIVRQVVQRRDAHVVILSDGHHLPWYEYELLVKRKAPCVPAPFTRKGADWLSCSAEKGVFYIGMIEWHSDQETVNTLLKLMETIFSDSLFHVSPFLMELSQGDLLVSNSTLITALRNRPDFIKRYKEILKTPDSVNDSLNRGDNGQKN
jgi:hypothetical protein